MRSGSETGFQPCPFCKSESLSVTAEDGEWQIKCFSCYAKGPTGESRTVAAYRWNLHAAKNAAESSEKSDQK